MSLVHQNATVSKSNFNEQFDHHFIKRVSFLIGFSKWKSACSLFCAEYKSIISVEIRGRFRGIFICDSTLKLIYIDALHIAIAAI